MSPVLPDREAPVGPVMVVLPNAEALRQVAGALGFLSARKRQVFVGVHHDPPGGPDLGRFDGAYAGLSVARLPNPEDDGWQALAATVRRRLDSPADVNTWTRTLLGIDRAIPPSRAALALVERHAPDVLVVVRLPGGAHRDYLRAARQLGVPSIFLALRADDIARGRLTVDVPDCVAVWNRAHRREVADLGIPVRRTAMVGAHLWTDVLETRAPMPREEYRRRLGIDTGRRLVVVAPPAGPAGALTQWFAAWRAAGAASSDPGVRQAAVVVFAGAGTSGAGDLALPDATAVIRAGIDFADQYDAARTLHDALASADAVVTAGAPLALEGFARALPVLAVSAGDRDLDRLAAAARAQSEWPWTAGSLSESVAGLARVLGEGCHTDGLAAVRGFVRPHGEDIEPGFLLARVVNEIAPRSVPAIEPAARPRLAAWAAARHWPPEPPLPRRHDAAGTAALFLVALPATGVPHWRGLFEVLVERGHRVTLVCDGDDARVAAAIGDVHGVGLGGRLGAHVSRAAEWTVAALDLRLPELIGADSAGEVRWRRRLDGVTLPAGVKGMDALAGRRSALTQVRATVDALDRSLAPSRAATRLVDRARPDAVVVLPAIDLPVAVDSWVTHLDLARAARARGIPVAASRVGTTAVEDALAQGALRPNGVSRSTAAAIVDELERWLASAPVPPRPTFAPLSRWRAAAALRVVAGIASARRSLSVRGRPVQRAASPPRDAADDALGRSSGPSGERR